VSVGRLDLSNREIRRCRREGKGGATKKRRTGKRSKWRRKRCAEDVEDEEGNRERLAEESGAEHLTRSIAAAEVEVTAVHYCYHSLEKDPFLRRSVGISKGGKDG
jgi:hypothetical protein